MRVIMGKIKLEMKMTDLEGDESDVGSDIVHRVAAYEQRLSRQSRHEQEMISALALGCYHLPGYSYCDDWLQYFQNNHPIFGLFCHNRVHPVGFTSRLLLLTGSIMFGLAVTNIVWLCFYFNGSDQNNPAVTINVQGVGDVVSNDTFQITQGMVLLWSVGGLLQASFDNVVWHLSACVCCLSSKRAEKYKCFATHFVIVMVVTCTAIGTLALLLRTSVDQSKSAANVDLKINQASLYNFLITYATQIALSLFVFYPLIGTILFTGILGCGHVPILGGRPYEIMMEEKRLQKKARKRSALGSGSDRV